MPFLIDDGTVDASSWLLIDGVETTKLMNPQSKLLTSFGSILVALAIWLPCVHIIFAPIRSAQAPSKGISPQARALAARHLDIWTDAQVKEQELSRMRRSNAEWDFMGRSFLVWSLGEMALREPEGKKDYLPVMDHIINETMRLEREQGIYFFLMSYARSRPFVEQPARSLFIDSEIALMLAVRRVVEEKPEYQVPLRQRVDGMVERMRRSKALVAESYPDECWLFDHAVALAAIRASDYLDGTDHSSFFSDWLACARTNLVHSQSGLMISSFSTRAEPMDGPEGSSIWMAAHCLRLINEEFANDQYQRALKELGRDLMGFAWAREWPRSWRNAKDIDSGMVIPLLDAGAGSSGLAFVGASSFGDREYLAKLQTTVEFAGFPLRRNGRLKYCASNQVGDAVMLYASVLGPVWQRVNGAQ